MQKQNKKTRKTSRKPFAFVWALSLLALVGAAISSPTAAATGILPIGDASALAIILPIAILLTAIVISVWRQTAQNALPSPEQFARAHAGASHKRR